MIIMIRTKQIKQIIKLKLKIVKLDNITIQNMSSVISMMLTICFSRINNITSNLLFIYSKCIVT